MFVECVPNFSEGRDQAVIDALCEAADSVVGSALLDVHSDPDHNRTVLTLAGQGEAVAEAAFRAIKVAVERIDMTRHEGVHPCLGAADVVPFVPLRGATMADCVGLAESLARRLQAELELPSYLYAQAAKSVRRTKLSWLRRPGFSGLVDALATDRRAPDVGERRPHPTAGITTVGARDFLVAFNIDLDTESVEIAEEVAKAVRESSGGMTAVQAKGMALPQQGRVQVSMNLLDVGTSDPGAVFEEVARVAQAMGASVVRSELVGLLPRAAAVSAAGTLLHLPEPLHERILEDRLSEELADPGADLADYLDQLASPGHLDPGGGSAVSLALALGRACLEKAIELSKGGKGELGDDDLAALSKRAPDPETLIDAARDDHRAFAELMEAWKLPKGPERKAALARARVAAVDVPEQVLHVAVEVAEVAAAVADGGNKNLVNDAAAAAELALAAGRIARLNARSNQKKKDRRGYKKLLERLEAAAARARDAAG
jgi:glutamate formiminotransferase